MSHQFIVSEDTKSWLGFDLTASKVETTK